MLIVSGHHEILQGGVTAIAEGANVARLGAEGKAAEILGHVVPRTLLGTIILCNCFNGISGVGLGSFGTCSLTPHEVKVVRCVTNILIHYQLVLLLLLQYLLPIEVGADFLELLLGLLRLRALQLCKEEVGLAVWHTGLRSSLLSILSAVLACQAPEVPTVTLSRSIS